MSARFQRSPAWRRVLFFGVLATGFSGSVVALVWQRHETTRLRGALEHRRDAAAALHALAVENRQLEAALARPPTPDSASAVQTELERLRQQVANAESYAGRKPAPAQPRPTPSRPMLPRSDPLASNRDPEKEMVRLEHFRNLGRATPSAAFQTMIWALRVENDDALTPLLSLSPQSRARVEALLEKLDPAARARFRTPEKVVSLLLSLEFLDNEALQIAGETISDPTNALLGICTWKYGREQPSEMKIPLSRTTDGWQFVIPDEVITRLPETLAEISLIIPSPHEAPW